MTADLTGPLVFAIVAVAWAVLAVGQTGATRDVCRITASLLGVIAILVVVTA